LYTAHSTPSWWDCRKQPLGNQTSPSANQRDSSKISRNSVCSNRSNLELLPVDTSVIWSYWFHIADTRTFLYRKLIDFLSWTIRLEKLPVNRLSRWEHVEPMRQHFWRKWSLEYLHYWQQWRRWMIKENPVHVGQIVLLKKDAALSLFWPLVRILDIYPDNNGIIRTVTL